MMLRLSVFLFFLPACLVGPTISIIGQSETVSDRYPACTTPNKCGYINRNGKMVIKPRFLDAFDFSEGLAAVQVKTPSGDKWGFIDSGGNVVIEPRFEEVRGFSQGKAIIVNPARKRGFIDHDGQLVIPANFTSAVPFSEGLAAVQLTAKGKIGFIDASGRSVIPPTFDRADSFSEGRAEACIDTRCGFIDSTGAWVVQPQYAKVEAFTEGLAAVKLTDGAAADWVYIDREGDVAIPHKYSWAGPFSEGLAAISMGGKVGYIDRSGAIVIGAQFADAEPFSDGIAVVLIENRGEYYKKWAYIDKTGKRLSKKFYWSYPGKFENGLAYIEKPNLFHRLEMPIFLTNSTVCYIDKKEKDVWCSVHWYNDFVK